MSDIIILFGEMGSGKNYHGEKLAKKLGYTFFDGDIVVTSEMAEKVSKFKPLSRDIIKNYRRVLAEAIKEKAAQANGLVVAQALYSNQDRYYLHGFLSTKNNVKFIWIKTSFFKNLKQIYSRPKGLRWVLYWLMNKPFFQKPTHDLHYLSEEMQ
jgi:gluconate kinase